jgi:Tfp pilus assembly protein PilX
MKNKYFLSASNRGVALIIALGTMIVILIAGSLVIYLVTRGLNVASGQKRYQSAFEACEGGIELGLAEVNESFIAGVDPDSSTSKIGKFTVKVLPEALFAMTAEGSVIKFGRGYFGVGYGMSKGGVNFYYRILARSVGTGGEGVSIELLQKKRIM